jgi:hypothetical protein
MQELLALPLLCGFHRSLALLQASGTHASTVTGDFSIPFG